MKRFNGFSKDTYKYIMGCCVAFVLFAAYFNAQLPQSPIEDNDVRSDEEIWMGYLLQGILLVSFAGGVYYLGRLHENTYLLEKEVSK